jgi:acetyltransferase-like isoleucine patch superfamily enzyme
MNIFEKVIYHLLLVFDSLLRWIGGGIGIKIRQIYYKNRCKNFGKNVRIDVGVHLENPSGISFGDNVWIMPYTIITSRPKFETFENRTIIYKNSKNSDGKVIIGNNVSIGLFNIIQGYGGIKINNYVTTSARVSIYSFSHSPFDPNDRGLITRTNAMNNSSLTICEIMPVVIEDGVWLGHNVALFGASIGTNTFVKSSSILNSDVGPNLLIGKYRENRTTFRFG